MTLPPPAPPPGNKKKNEPKPKAPEVDPWDGVLGEQEQDAIPPDLARKLLDLNPALREAGEDTMRMVERSRKQASAQATAAQTGAAPIAATTAIPKSTRIIDALADVKAALDRDEKRVDAEIKKLQAEKSALKPAVLDRFCRWLSEHDPDLRSPVTQQALEDEKAYLTKIGFSVKGYIAAQRKGAK
ncbi:MAG: hypothetical protein IT381_14635 [Deltaproteobacteria bacterium]|nr:hypothetical protein [Deltaproteobacteria bacterium]